MLAALFNVAAAEVNDADALEALERHRRLNDLFLSAIDSGDKYVFDRALEAGADVNYARGQPLQRAAGTRNFLFMKELIIRGADAADAIGSMETEQSGIQRRQKKDQWGDYTGRYTYKSRQDEDRWKQLGASIKTLKDYQKTFIADVMPLESLRLQHETLQELRALKRDVAEAIHGKPMNKPRLKAPRG